MSDLVLLPPQALQPARDLREVTHNCDEDTPLPSGDPRWQDFSPARGDDAIRKLHNELRWRREGTFVHGALVSHGGAGKSTEILRLTARLEPQYETLYLATTVEMDPYQIESEDLLLVLAVAVEARLRAIGMPLPEELLNQVSKWFDSVTRTTSWRRSARYRSSCCAPWRSTASAGA